MMSLAVFLLASQFLGGRGIVSSVTRKVHGVLDNPLLGTSFCPQQNIVPVKEFGWMNSILFLELKND